MPRLSLGPIALLAAACATHALVARPPARVVARVVDGRGAPDRLERALTPLSGGGARSPPAAIAMRQQTAKRSSKRRAAAPSRGAPSSRGASLDGKVAGLTSLAPLKAYGLAAALLWAVVGSVAG